MKLNEISIRNLKAITELDIAFDKDKSITLLYGNNGIGKTTVLESISLLGHISSMRKIKVSSGGMITEEHSKFLEEEYLKGKGIVAKDFPSDKIETSHIQIIHKMLCRDVGGNVFESLHRSLKDKNLKEWFDNHKFEKHEATIRYNIVPEISD